MEKIKILNINRAEGYIELNYQFNLAIPESFALIPNKSQVASSYDGAYSIEVIDNVEVFVYRSSKNFLLNVSVNDILLTLESMYEQSRIKFNNFQLKPYDAIIGISFDGSTWS